MNAPPRKSLKNILNYCGNFDCFSPLSTGPGIKKNFNMSAGQNYVANRDVVQTVLHALGLEKGRYMTGRVLQEVFENAGRRLCNRGNLQLLLTLTAVLLYNH